MSDDKRTDLQTPETLEAAAFARLRHWIAYPHLYPQDCVFKIAESLWKVYLCRTTLYRDFDEFLAECVRRVSLAHIRAAQAAKGAR